MAELFERLRDRELLLHEQIKNIMYSGHVAMEDAQMVAELAPGELEERGIDILDGFDESDENSQIALEAALSGLSKVKIAFIVAVVAFILRYIKSLHNSAGYSYSGGGGGWGGSAPNTFKTDHQPGTQQFEDAVDDHVEDLNSDAKTNYERFSASVKELQDWTKDVNYLKSIKGSQKLINLLNLLKRTLNDEAVQRLLSEGKGVLSPELTAVANFDKDVTDDVLKNLHGAIQIIADKYLSTNIIESALMSDKLGIPRFVIGEKAEYQAAVAVMKLAEDSIDRFSDVVSELETLLSSVKNKTQPQQIDPLIEYIGKNFLKSNSSQGQSGTILVGFIAILSQTKRLGEDDFAEAAKAEVSIADKLYFDTAAINKLIKQFMKEVTHKEFIHDGKIGKREFSTKEATDGRSVENDIKNFISNLAGTYINPGKQQTTFEGLVNSISTYNSRIKDQYKTFEKVEDITEEFLNEIERVKNSMTSRDTLNQRVFDKHKADDPDAEPTEGMKEDKDIARYMNLIYDGFSAINTIFAGTSTISAQVETFSKTKATVVISALTNLNQFYNDADILIKNLNQEKP